MTTQTKPIALLRDILRVERIPWQWWGALLQDHGRDRNLLLVIADWLEEQGDELHATAWREVQATGHEPLRENFYSYVWLRKRMPAMSYPATKWGGSHPDYQRALFNDDLFYALLCVEPHGRVRPASSTRGEPAYVCMCHDYGRPGALQRLAHAQALLLSGFRPEVP